MELKSITKIEAMIVALEKLAVAGAKVAADGKVDLTDLPIVINLLTDVNVIVEGIKGATDIPAEVKDLSGDEIQAIVGQVIASVAKVKAALKEA